jgi:short-subunit dehydrogenase
LKILISGASSGIGRALAIEYASIGADLLLIGRDKNRLQNTADICKAIGASEVSTAVVDVRSSAAVNYYVKELPEKYQTLDLIIANAGVRVVENGAVDLNAVTQNIETNYYGVVNCIEAFIENTSVNFKAVGIISSIGALRATHNSGAYSASKAALNKWAGALRLKLRSKNIPITIVNLGFVKTEMTAGLKFRMPGLIGAETAALLIRRAIEKKKTTTVIPWQSMVIWKTLEFLPDSIYDPIIDFIKNRQV